MTTPLFSARLPLLLALAAFATISACNCTTAKEDRCQGVVCTAADACHTAGVCLAATGACTSPAATDGTSCADTNLCNGAEVCTAGVCAAPSGSAIVCSAPTACHTATGATCAPATGLCMYPAVTDGTSCADANLCNGDEVCTAGACAPMSNSAVTCTAPGTCHTATGATCAPATGLCTYPAITDGTTCADANLCNGDEACTAGSCAPKAGSVVTCTAPPQCHVAAGASCNPANGSCSYPNAADGSSCTLSGSCAGVTGCQSGQCGCTVSTFTLRVVAPGGAPIVNAPVQSDGGGEPKLTDENGTVTYTLAPGSRAQFTIKAGGYALSTKVIPSAPVGSFEAIAYLLPRGQGITFDAGTALNAHYSNEYMPDAPYRDAVIDLPANSLVNGAGDPVEGPVTLFVTSLDPTSAQRTAAPGPFQGTSGDSTVLSLQSLAMAEIVVEQDGQPLFLKEGQLLTLHFRLPASLQEFFGPSPGDYSGWRYDPDAALWLEDGSAAGNFIYSDDGTDWPDDTFTEGPNGQRIVEWRARVTSFGWWSPMLLNEGTNCVRLKVLRAGDNAPLANIAVFSDGEDFNSRDTERTGPAGEAACIEFMAGGTVHLSVEDPWLANGTLSSAVTLQGNGDAQGSCGAATNQCAIKQVVVAVPTCVSGRVYDHLEEPVGGAVVVATSGHGLSARSTHTTTAADGTYCVQAPSHTKVRISVSRQSAPGDFEAASVEVDTAAAPSTCGATCTNVAGNLYLERSRGRHCVKGRMFAFQEDQFPREPVPAGMPVYVFALGNEGSLNVGCPDESADIPPAGWGSGTTQLIATGASGPDGRFCVEFNPYDPNAAGLRSRQSRAPLAPEQQQYIVAPGDCAIRRNAIQDWARGWCGLDLVQPDPLDLSRACELENCIDLGDFDYGYLYDSSGCHRTYPR